jgi:hypothetical protein
MAKGIDDPADAPAPLVRYGPNFCRPCGNRAGEKGVGIGNHQYDPDGAAVRGLRTEIVMTGRFICQPELSAFNRQVRYDLAAFARDSEEFGGAKRGFIKVYRFGATPDVEKRGNRCFGCFRTLLHNTPDRYGVAGFGFSPIKRSVPKLFLCVRVCGAPAHHCSW